MFADHYFYFRDRPATGQLPSLQDSFSLSPQVYSVQQYKAVYPVRASQSSPGASCSPSPADTTLGGGVGSGGSRETSGEQPTCAGTPRPRSRQSDARAWGETPGVATGERRAAYVCMLCWRARNRIMRVGAGEKGASKGHREASHACSLHYVMLAATWPWL